MSLVDDGSRDMWRLMSICLERKAAG
jgi:hypothetical protein